MNLNPVLVDSYQKSETYTKTETIDAIKNFIITENFTLSQSGSIYLDSNVKSILSVMTLDNNNNYAYSVPTATSVYITSANALYAYRGNSDTVKIKVSYIKI